VQPRAVIDAYYSSLSGAIADIPTATPSGVFELNASRHPRFAQELLGGFNHGSEAAAPPVRNIILGTMRDLAKWLFIWLLGRVFYRRRSQHLLALGHAKLVFIGFVTSRGGQLVAKDFDGFRESLPMDASSISIGLRLPFLGLRRYLQGDEDVLPVLAYARLADVLKGIVQQVFLARALLTSTSIRNETRSVCLRDILSGHAVASYVVGQTVAWLSKSTQISTTIYFPMERHDWEQIALTQLSGVRRTEAVQNCTFSPADLNMYRCTRHAPSYRQAMPDRLHVIEARWGQVFRDELGLTCEITTLVKHRFSGTRYPLVLDGVTPRVLYLASINRDKLMLDLEALFPLCNRIKVEVRLHPSLRSYPLPACFARSVGLSGSFGWCVFSDTSMVFQLDCEHEHLLFIEHDCIPSQDPTQWFADFGSQRIAAAALPALLLDHSPNFG
jgi:hypothetical protein